MKKLKYKRMTDLLRLQIEAQELRIKKCGLIAYVQYRFGTASIKSTVYSIREKRNLANLLQLL